METALQVADGGDQNRRKARETMTTFRFVVAVAATLVVPSVDLKAESGRGKVQLVSHAHAVHLHGEESGSYVQTGGCKYIGPYGPYVDCSYDVSCSGCHPHNPCCGTIFSEMFCDIVSHFHGLFSCQRYWCDETLGDCCGTVANHSGRLRDYLPCHSGNSCDNCGGLLSWLFAPLWGGYCDSCGDDYEYDYSAEILNDGETMEPSRPALEPVPEPARSPRPATPVANAGRTRGRTVRRSATGEPNRLRSYIIASEAQRPRSAVRRSEFREPVMTRRESSPVVPRVIPRATKPENRLFMTPEQALATKPAETNQVLEPQSDARIRITHGPPVNSEMVRFGDQFGKTARSGFDGVEFR
jgi:hypothetical protein